MTASDWAEPATLYISERGRILEQASEGTVVVV